MSQKKSRKCLGCGKKIPDGDGAYYWPGTNGPYCFKCYLEKRKRLEEK